MDAAIRWVWRDLVLSILATTEDDALVQEIISFWEKEEIALGLERTLKPQDGAYQISMYRQFHFAWHVLTRILPDGAARGRRIYDAELYPKASSDGHWTPKMRAAVPQLLDLLLRRRITAFEASPSVTLYLSIVDSSPDLKPTLLQITRDHFLHNTHDDTTLAWAVAARIFALATQTDDLFRLMDAVPDEFGRTPKSIAEARLVALVHFASQPRVVRKKALHLLEKCVLKVVEEVYSEFNRFFPYLQDAYDLLECVGDEDEIDPDLLRKHACLSVEEERARDSLIDQLYSVAKGGPDGGDCGSDWSELEEHIAGVDSEDSDCEEQRDIHRPDLSRPLRDYEQLLNKWPCEETAKVRKEVARRLRDEFGIDEALIKRCQIDVLRCCTYT